MNQYPTAQQILAESLQNELSMNKDILDRFYKEARESGGDSFTFEVASYYDMPESIKSFLRSKGFFICWDRALRAFKCSFEDTNS